MTAKPPQEHNGAATPHRGPPGWSIGLVGAFVLATVLAVLLAWGRPLYHLIHSQVEIRAWVEGLGIWGPAGIIALQVAQTLFAPIPGQAIGAVSGYLFGTWWGTLYAMAGLVLGSLVIFLLARRFGRPLLRRWVSQSTMEQIDDLSQRSGALAFFLIWLLPLFPDDLACLAAGLTPMPLRQFLLLVTLGRLPGVLITTWGGTQATRVGPMAWSVLLVGIAVVAVVVWVWRDSIQRLLFGLVSRLVRPTHH
jgi:uncharacterized membrane protein YdjX (TVP38/TMEM64 family)